MQNREPFTRAPRPIRSSLLAGLIGILLVTGPRLSRAGEEPAAKTRPEASASKTAGHPHGLGLELAGFSINGRFDLAYEVINFAPDSTAGIDNRLSNYHHFVFLGRNRHDEPFFLNIELIDRTFYELGLKIGKRHRVRFGKILVPFGADPLWHHAYGGLSGFDQRLLPAVWAEHGAAYETNLVRTNRLSLDNEFFFVTGLAGAEDKVLALNGASDLSTVAIGDRLRFGFDRYSAAISFYYSPYAPGKSLIMWGGDLKAGPGFLPWPYLDRLSLAAGLIRADVSSDILGNYFHLGSYLEIGYHLPLDIQFRYRAGSIAFENHQGVIFDDRPLRKTAADTTAHSFTIWRRIYLLTLSVQYLLNIEAADETDNDLLRFSAAIDF